MIVGNDKLYKLIIILTTDSIEPDYNIPRVLPMGQSHFVSHYKDKLINNMHTNLSSIRFSSTIILTVG